MSKSWFDEYDQRKKTSSDASNDSRSLDSLPVVNTNLEVRDKPKQKNVELDKAMLQNVKSILEHVDGNLHHIFNFHSNMVAKQVEMMQSLITNDKASIKGWGEMGEQSPAIAHDTTGNNTIVVVMEPEQIQKYMESTMNAAGNHMTLPYFMPETEKTYIVKKGDTLWSIARTFNTTVDELKRINHLSTDTLQIGQKLVVSTMAVTPTQPSEHILYVVEAGDSLWSIAKRYGTTVSELKRINHLVSDHLRIGQSLQVPNMMIKTPATPMMQYTVQSGDTLWSIARRYHTTVDAIKHVNHLKSDLLSIAQILQIPSDHSKSSSMYVVVEGDSLWSIAKKYGTTVSEIKHLNHLKNDTLSIGQTLQIPIDHNKNSSMYIVVEGDSLWSIAKQYHTTVSAIKHLNHLTSDALSIGQQLQIPNN